jgi:xylose dehydrogenase (NAD/NADP)
MNRKLSWGILGTGNIARQFSVGVNASKRGTLAAVASRDPAKSRAFGQTHQAARFHDSYEALLRDPAVDAVYVSLPNSMHHEWTVAALRAGKHVLCEKPFSVTTAQAEEMFLEAGKTGRVVMEAFMYRCHPLTLAVQEQVARGAIGKIKLIRTSFCYRTLRIDDNIRFSAPLAGGALMDVGCYCISFSRLFAGAEPTEMRVTGKIHPSGVDEQVSGFLQFPDDVQAAFTCGMGVQADNAAYLCGDEGYIEIPIPWKPPAVGAQFTIAHSTPPKMDQKSLSPPDLVRPPRETFSVDTGGDLYGVEADDFANAVLDGKPPRISAAETLGNMRVLEELRRQIRLRY